MWWSCPVAARQSMRNIAPIPVMTILAAARNFCGSVTVAVVLAAAAAETVNAGSDAATEVPKPTDPPLFTTEDIQREAVKDNLKRVGVQNAAMIETRHFFVAGSLPEEKLREIGAALDKIESVACDRMGLISHPWKGKLAVYCFTDPQELRSFMRFVANERRHDPDITYYSLKGDNPYMVTLLDRNAKGKDLAVTMAEHVAIAFLRAGLQSGYYGFYRDVELTTPVATAYSRIIALQSKILPDSEYTAYRRQLRNLARKNIPLEWMWRDKRLRPEQRNILLMGLIEYFCHQGNVKQNIVYFLPRYYDNKDGIFGPVDPDPKWLLNQIDISWRKWVLTGK